MRSGEKKKVGLPEFESGSKAPKAPRMDQATPQTRVSGGNAIPPIKVIITSGQDPLIIIP